MLSHARRMLVRGQVICQKCYKDAEEGVSVCRALVTARDLAGAQVMNVKRNSDSEWRDCAGFCDESTPDGNDPQETKEEKNNHLL